MKNLPTTALKILIAVVVALTGNVLVAPAASASPDCDRTVLQYGDRGRCVRELQQELIGYGYDTRATGNFASLTKAAVKAFQADHGVPATGKVARLTRAALINKRSGTQPAASLPASCTRVKQSLCISKDDRKLRHVVNGTVQTTLDARFGDARGARYATAEGIFTVSWKSRDHVSSIYDAPMPYAMFFKGGQAVHYSADFAAKGYNGSSHGCVNIRDKAAMAALFDRIPVGTRVVVY